MGSDLQAGDGGNGPLPITRLLAEFAAGWQARDMPERIQTESARAFLNWMGCALGGSREAIVGLAAYTVAELGGNPVASLIGRYRRTDIASAAFVNCIASSCLAFDDAHLATVTHPSGPVAAALFAFAESRPVSGADFLSALALGMEVTCRLSNVLLLPPARFNLGFYVTGLTAPIGVALAVGNLMRLDAAQMNWAIGLAASQSGGFRASHGTMTAHFRPGHAARCGIWAAMLASKGFTCTPDILETEKGFTDVFSADVRLDRATDGLGRDFELLTNMYKPYPCGIVIHPTIDACLDIRQQLEKTGEELMEVTVRAHPLALRLTGIRDPADTLESHVSLFHWVAACLLRGTAGLAETEQSCIDDPGIAALRQRVQAVADPALKADESIVEVTTTSGAMMRSHIENARGSAARPLIDAELDAKFMAQAGLIISHDHSTRLLTACRNTWLAADLGREVSAAMAQQ